MRVRARARVRVRVRVLQPLLLLRKLLDALLAEVYLQEVVRGRVEGCSGQ